MSKNIIQVKRGYETLTEGKDSPQAYTFFPNSLITFHTLFDQSNTECDPTLEKDYRCYALDFDDVDKNLIKSRSFEILIPKSEIEIISLLDSCEYSNFLIAKALIKHKLRHG